jgi:hypothetical protein
MNLIHTIFSFLINAGEFVLFTVIAKMIIGRWIAEKILQWLKNKNERNAAIWEHFEHNHPAESVLDCNLGKCQVFQDAQMAAAIPQLI